MRYLRLTITDQDHTKQNHFVQLLVIKNNKNGFSTEFKLFTTSISDVKKQEIPKCSAALSRMISSHLPRQGNSTLNFLFPPMHGAVHL